MSGSNLLLETIERFSLVLQCCRDWEGTIEVLRPFELSLSLPFKLELGFFVHTALKDEGAIALQLDSSASFPVASAVIVAQTYRLPECAATDSSAFRK